MLSQSKEETKVCLKCKETLVLEEYGKDKRQTDGLNRYCKPCHRENCAKARMNRSKPCVYQLFFTDGCTYIGSTIQNFSDRLAVHRAKVRTKIHTNRIFNRYEPEEISGRVLLELKDRKELRMNEYVLIKHFRESYGDKCLNQTDYTGIEREQTNVSSQGSK
jgi:hypothetical protein|tara:strand:+ start:123 stop:608 length:486 start_codon:yes stop_codon:yes gene_type:complete